MRLKYLGLFLLSATCTSKAFSKNAIEISAGPINGSAYRLTDISQKPTNPEGITASLTARRGFNETFAIQIGASLQAAEVTANGKRSPFSVLPVIVGLRYAPSNFLGTASLRPHLDLGVGPYLSFYSGATKPLTDVVDAGTKFGVKPGAGLDFIFSESIYATMNVAYHLVPLYGGFEATVGLGVLIN